MRENSGVTRGESCDKNASMLKVSDALNEVITELKARRVCSRLPESSAASDDEDEQGGRLLKHRVTAMLER